jgi:hypothetical protein
MQEEDQDLGVNRCGNYGAGTVAGPGGKAVAVAGTRAGAGVGVGVKLGAEV